MMDLHVELHWTNELLERIAVALEQKTVPFYPASSQHKRGPESIVGYGDGERECLKQEIANLVHQQGLAPAQEQELIDETLNEELPESKQLLR